MLRLPRLGAGVSDWRLPLFPRTAVALANALVIADRDAAEHSLERILRSDPALTLWLLCRRPFTHPPAPRELSRWLASHAVEVLQWQSDERDSLPASAAEASEWSLAMQAAFMRNAPKALSESGDAAESMVDRVASSLRAWLATGITPENAVPALIPEWLCSRADAALPSCEDESAQAARSATGESFASVKGSELESLSSDADVHNESDDAEIASTLESMTNGCPILDLPAWMSERARFLQLRDAFDRTLQQEKLASMRELAYGASHEINNPLANISTRAQSLLRDERDPERRRKLATIHTQAMRAHEMISDMMLFAKPPALRPQEVDLHQLVDAAIRELEPDAQRQSTQLHRTPGNHPCKVEADPEQLLLALRALGANALQAMGSGGRIDWEVVEPIDFHAQSGDAYAAAMVVRDTGPGMSDEVLRHAFDPFFSGREAGRGLGFGLSKVWKIMQLHGGDVELASLAGKGTTVTLRFRRHLASPLCEKKAAG